MPQAVLTTFRTDGQALLWCGDGETLRVEPWGRNAVRVRASRNQHIADTHWGLLPLNEVRDAAQSHISLDSDGFGATVTCGELVVRLSIEQFFNAGAGGMQSRCSLVFTRPDGTELFREEPAGGSLALKARSYHPVGGGQLSAAASFVAPQDERLYGMGEYQQQFLNLKGCTFELAHRNSQASVPFVVSSAGYGFLWNNPAIGTAVFAKNRTQWTAQSTPQIDYWVTAGNTPAQIVRQYANATGYAPQMPDWGLGFWQCKLRYWNQEQVLNVAREFKRRNIPISVIIIDFFHWPHMGDFRFEDEFWPDPKAMCDELHQMGIKVMVSIWPQISLQSENYATMHANNLLVQADNGIDVGMMFVEPSQFLDATNPATREFVWQQCKQHYVDMGVDGFWLDEAEPEYGTYDFSNYRYFEGPGQQVSNVYPAAYNKLFFDGQLAQGREGDIVNLTRCAWAGSQRYGSLVWSGDVGSSFEDFRAQIVCAIQMGMAGIPWFTTDMGGFHDGDVDSPLFRELLMRWCAFSCFSPVMRNHGDRFQKRSDGSTREYIHAADGTERLASGGDNEPWSYDQQVEDVFRKFIRVRTALHPYLTELFQRAHECGDPLVRGLFYEFPEDSRCGDIADEYLFGPDLLVAPVTQAGITQRSVYLPGDERVSWTDLGSGKRYAGGSVVSVECPVDVLPVFAREGRDHGLAGLL
ncbi:glycosyl hydrolase [Bombiscardovia nodaiensis]|uniref:Glycosyl hydrolase n=1 Tax=Bombiscardovia nodaiensis TaxID=2932181 RepID=A0ABM8B6N6_9BIFI|nr:glycosyl hydrolase [Bombiscardovia nodaiensis]